jgi:NADH:ubiquinone oxidoreductase subunit 5 (subunit L)/multisubunit Na+/H+ antiporter MnhA subunit
MTMPPTLKMAALIVTIIGLLTAIELAATANSPTKTAYKASAHHFSNILGYFPALIHRLSPKASLVLGQSAATKLDQTWLQAAGPKGVTLIQIIIAKVVNDISRGTIKTYLTIFLLTITLAILLALI